MAKAPTLATLVEFIEQGHSTPPANDSHQRFHEVVGQYNEYGQHFKSQMTMGEMAQKLAAIAQTAESAIMSETDDWFDQHTIKRNMKEIKGYVAEFGKVAVEHDTLRQRMSALYDDMGRVLERYFEIGGGGLGPEDAQQQYDTGDGEEIVAQNTGKEPVDPEHAAQMSHEGGQQVDNMGGAFPPAAVDNQGPHNMDDPALSVEPEDEEEVGIQKESEGYKRAKGLSERIVRLAREQLRGDQLVRFDTLPRETQIRAAWKLIR